MANEENIIYGFFKDVPISIRSGSVTGGRKTSIKQFPNKDTQNVEDLGLMPRKYTLDIIVSDKKYDQVSENYFSYRDKLLKALESKEPSELIHPLYGRIDNVVAVSYSLNENFSAFGDSTISVNFEVNDNTGIPQSSGNFITEVFTLNTNVIESVQANIADSFNITQSFTGNFTAAIDKANAIIDQANQATSFIGETAQTLNEYSAQIGELSANVNSLVTQPLQLASSITGLFYSVNGLYQSAGATLDTFIGFFGCGEDDEEIKQDTAGRIERKNNNDVLNLAVAASSLSYAYLAITRIDFKTTREIDTLTNELDKQYDLVQSIGGESAKTASVSSIIDGSQIVKDSITEMRVIVLKALDDIRINTSQIISVQTTPTTARLLGFNYYGNDQQGQTIVDLNNISDASFIEGSIEVITK